MARDSHTTYGEHQNGFSKMKLYIALVQFPQQSYQESDIWSWVVASPVSQQIIKYIQDGCLHCWWYGRFEEREDSFTKQSVGFFTAPKK